MYVDCDTTITTPGVELTSPDYPQTYPLDQDCKQLIEFEAYQKVRLVFKELSLEYGNACEYVKTIVL